MLDRTETDGTQGSPSVAAQLIQSSIPEELARSPEVQTENDCPDPVFGAIERLKTADAIWLSARAMEEDLRALARVNATVTERQRASAEETTGKLWDLRDEAVHQLYQTVPRSAEGALALLDQVLSEEGESEDVSHVLVALGSLRSALVALAERRFEAL